MDTTRKNKREWRMKADPEESDIQLPLTRL